MRLDGRREMQHAQLGTMSLVGPIKAGCANHAPITREFHVPCWRRAAISQHVAQHVPRAALEGERQHDNMRGIAQAVVQKRA